MELKSAGETLWRLSSAFTTLFAGLNQVEGSISEGFLRIRGRTLASEQKLGLFLLSSNSGREVFAIVIFVALIVSVLCILHTWSSFFFKKKNFLDLKFFLCVGRGEDF